LYQKEPASEEPYWPNITGIFPMVVSALATARPICLRLFLDWAELAAVRTFWTAGTSRPTSTAMMAITTSNSMSVKPRRCGEGMERIMEIPRGIVCWKVASSGP